MHKTKPASPHEPTTLAEAVIHFANPAVALAFVVRLRWPQGVACPRCDSKRHSYLAARLVWKCLDCKRQFSAKIGTVMEDSPLPLHKWLIAFWLLANARNGVSSYELARSIGITQKSAWHLLHRVREAMHGRSGEKMGGEVEIDESYFGGKPQNRGHALSRIRKGVKFFSRTNKTAVLGILQRGPGGTSRVRTRVIKDARRSTLAPHIYENVNEGAAVFTDSLMSYTSLSAQYVHEIINHNEAYARGPVHVNGLENFWSLLKRTIKGTYICPAPFHLSRYCLEQGWRYDHRRLKDSERFALTVANAVGRRLTWRTLATGWH